MQVGKENLPMELEEHPMLVVEHHMLVVAHMAEQVVGSTVAQLQVVGSTVAAEPAPVR
jgi:hypothetical protein